MQTYMLYCDLSTIKSTAEEINSTLDNFSTDYIQMNDSLWFFKFDESHCHDPLHKEEHIFNEYFEQLLNENSIIFIERLRNDYMYQLPDVIDEFLKD